LEGLDSFHIGGFRYKYSISFHLVNV
jgi:hypothetical protein